MDFVVILLGSLFAGVLGSLTGLGGGIIVIPLLTMCFGVPMHYAIGASLVAVIGTSTGAASAYVKEGFTNIRVGIFLEIGTTLGAIAGAFIAGVLPGNIIGVIFGVMLIFTSIMSFVPKPDGVIPLEVGSMAHKLKLYGTFPAEGGVLKEYSARNVFGGFSMMGLAGILSGLLGIGSGVLKVLAMDNIMKLPFKVSTTTSNFMIGVTAVASAVIYYQRGEIIMQLCTPVLMGILIGSFLGSKIFMRLKTKLLKRIFSFVILIVAVYVMYRGITGDIN